MGTDRSPVSPTPCGAQIGKTSRPHVWRFSLCTLLDEDLVRIKTVLEEGKIPRDVQRHGSEPPPMLKAEQLER
ncbi:hypothetical protein NITMOv2_2857 [Nitrospira moscoviensis]|uniref:Uncharacterized protein n=1 Tax=Nitrospira moscoviensis TaxID=42253 RepID=A0A0K2GE85_NITMO|nr:hypothetical protein NITMOv2_2857 [Nitrospira moscoviensis]